MDRRNQLQRRLSGLRSAFIWVVPTTLGAGRRSVTGLAPPASRDQPALFGRVFVEAAQTGAAVSAALVAIDRRSLRYVAG